MSLREKNKGKKKAPILKREYRGFCGCLVIVIISQYRL